MRAMKQSSVTILLGIACCFFAITAKADPGDTVRIHAKDTIHWSGYGGYFTEADFPGQAGDDKSYQRVWLKATLGCPQGGCSEWDYTTKFAIYKPSGQETYLPEFKIDDSIRNTVQLKRSPAYRYTYSGNSIVDSSRVDSVRVTFHNRSPSEPVETRYYWEAGRPVFDVDQQGNIVDTHQVAVDTTLTNQVDTIKGTPIEIGRAATPYSGNRQKGFNYPWYFDVTDYQNLLKGNQNLRAFYRGPRDGFTIKLEFIMIEGTPPREPVSVQNIYKSPATGFYYGFDTSDINGDRLVPTDFTMPNDADEAKIRVSIKGHGFGDANANCAEFCRKFYRVLINQEQVAQNIPWRDNCDMTPVYPQTGTWILSRSNWCPGTVSLPYDHEITDKVSPGQDFTVKMNMQSHNFIEPSGRDYTDPRWVIDAQFIAYGEKNRDNDVAIKRIISPSKDPRNSRFNPICGSPEIEIQNQGAKTLESATITYGAKGTDKATYKWEGSLDFMESTEIKLPSVGNWSNLFSGLKPFEVKVSKPNGKDDEYEANNKTSSEYRAVNQYPGKFRLRLITNDASDETSYVLRKVNGKGGPNIVYERTDFEDNSLYFDTFDLDPGCYEFILKDERGSPFNVGDGLSFFANNEGNGTAQLVRMENRIELEDGDLEENFGRQVRKAFTVGYPVSREDQTLNQQLQIHPNPASKNLAVALELENAKDLQVTIYSMKGKKLRQKSLDNYKSGGFNLDIESLEAGAYMMKVKTSEQMFNKRFIKQ